MTESLRRTAPPAPSLRRALLRWYRRSARDLPWRRTRDPYAIWVSEVMLQQTTVATVAPRFGRFLDRFPTAAALAAAPRRDVLAEWSGLGYYRRAARLHEAAGEIVRRHNGAFPADPAARLPGVGDYTRAAVLSIAYGLPEAAVDVNVARVLTRLEALNPRARDAKAVLRALARGLLPPARPGEWNQALMDLGAMVCLARSPRCGACPLARLCRARRLGLQESLPARRAAAPVLPVRMDCLLCEKGGRVLLERRTRGLLAGHWGLPESSEVPRGGAPLAEVRQRITRHDVTLRLWPGRAISRGTGMRWVPKSELGRFLVSSLWRKALPGRSPALKGSRPLG